MKLKVRVTPQENKRVQEILFRMGHEGHDGGKKIKHVDEPYLFIYDKYLGYTSYLDHFNAHNFKEVTPSYFEAFETKLWKVLNGYKE